MGCGSDSNDSGDNGGTGGMDGGPGGGGSNDCSAGNNALKIVFSPMYSAFDGQHDFKLPVKVTGADGTLKVKTCPEGLVDSEPSADGVMLKTRKAGDGTLVITDSKGNSSSAQIHITSATPEEWSTGKDRYNNGVEAFEGGIPTGPGAGGGDAGPMRNPDSACSYCHRPDGAGGMGPMLADGGMLQIDIEHTPQQTGGYSDDELINIFTQAMKPAGSPWRVLPDINLGGMSIAQRIYSSFHKWNVTDSEKKGIVVYLRSLEPKAQGMIDFGGLVPPGGADGGFRLPRPDAGSTGGSTTDAGTGSDAGVDSGS